LFTFVGASRSHLCCIVGRYAEFSLTVEPTDTVVLSDQPLILDCVGHYIDDEGTHTASVQWLKDSQPIALSPPSRYGLLLLLLFIYPPDETAVCFPTVPFLFIYWLVGLGPKFPDKLSYGRAFFLQSLLDS